MQKYQGTGAGPGNPRRDGRLHAKTGPDVERAERFHKALD
jgi:hypothetical protein